MELEMIAISLSVFSTIVAMISAYIAQFKKGKVTVAPLRAYRLEPLNFHEGDQSYRAVRMRAMFTFMNTGAINKAIADLRICVSITDKGKDLILDWEDECPSLECKYEEQKYAAQPTLGPYESISKVYTFCSKFQADQGTLVREVEDLCSNDGKKFYTATLEIRKGRKKWGRLYRFAFRHSGRIDMQTDFEKINSV